MSKTKYYAEYEATGNTQLLIEDSIYINRTTKNVVFSGKTDFYTGGVSISDNGVNTLRTGISLINIATGGEKYQVVSGIYNVSESGFSVRRSDGLIPFVIQTNGFIGMNRVDPIANLDIRDNEKTNVTHTLSLGSTDVLQPMRIVFSRNTNSNYEIQVVEDGVDYRNLVLNPTGGNVGIGTQTPTEKFTVNGDANIIGLTTQYTGSTTGFRNVIHSNTTGKLYSVPGGVNNTSGTSGSSYSKLVEYKESNYSVLSTEEGKTFVHTGSSTFTFSLPTLSNDQIGYEYTFVKKSNTATIYIKAPNYEYIEDSASGAYIYSNDPNFATITLKFIYRSPSGYGNYWVIKYANGIWITTTV